MVERLHRAYFTEQDSIFDHEALTRLAVEAGLDRDEVASVLAGDAYSDHVDTDEAMARALGATGVPLFVIDRKYGISGAQPADTITQVLERAWARGRSSVTSERCVWFPTTHDNLSGARPGRAAGLVQRGPGCTRSAPARSRSTATPIAYRAWGADSASAARAGARRRRARALVGSHRAAARA